MHEIVMAALVPTIEAVMNLRELIENYCPSEAVIHRPYIIAEAGVNHECNMDLARRLIDEAKEGGADAIKFQTYKANTIAAKDSPSYWDLSKEPTDSQYKLFQKYDKFWKGEYEALALHCEQIGIEFLSTPFDIESARFLSDMVSVFKVSSSDMNNKPFIDYLCGFGKPIILSTGASYMWEVEQSVSWIEARGNSLALLHCILNYPTDDANANLAMIQSLARKFPRNLIGYSDHTLPKDMKTLEVATLLGACIIEKHFSHDKTLPGNDHYHAMDKEDLKQFHRRIDTLLKLLGDHRRYPLASEAISRSNARRSLIAARRIPPGKTVEADDLTWKRPGNGIDPRDYDRVIGRVARIEIAEDTVLHWGLLDD
jgi:sialic acid synthase SpsE